MEKIQYQATFYNWRLYIRNGTYYVDGRSNGSNIARHSLGSSDYNEAIENLKMIDISIAAKNGNRDAIQLEENRNKKDISISEGIGLYLGSISNRQVIEERSKKTPSRYKAVLQKFEEYLRVYTKVQNWSQVSDELLPKYAAWLKQPLNKKEFQQLQYRRCMTGYAIKTLQFEIDTLKQVSAYLTKTKRLELADKLTYSVSAPDVSDRYCYSYEEVQEILKLTSNDKLLWLHDICLVLSRTGVRIGELEQMQWSDLKESDGRFSIRIANGQLADGTRRRTKNRQDRCIPLDSDIMDRLKTYKHHSDGYIFHGPLGGRLKPDTIRNILYRDVLSNVEKNLRDRGLDSNATQGCLHSFRHYFCSQCVRQGKPQQIIQKLMGHKDSAMIRHYLHLHDNDLHDIMDDIKL